MTASQPRPTADWWAINERISANIQRLVRESGRTHRELAAELGWTRTSFRARLYGARHILASHLVVLHDTFGWPFEDMLR